jgi:putative protease
VKAVDVSSGNRDTAEPRLIAEVYSVEDARQAADGGANEVVFDPFLRHPVPPMTRVRNLADELAARGVSFRLRTPTIVRPEDRPSLDKWLALELPLLSGHVGVACELASSGRGRCRRLRGKLFQPAYRG